MNSSAPPHISVIVTTYNWPAALERVLIALSHQSDQVAFEVIVADDGSTKETADLIGHLQKSLPYDLQHCWQPDIGFRAAKIRNQAAALARGQYLIFIDGDCIPPSSFIARHQQLAQRGCFVVGNRILLSPGYTEQIVH